MRKYFLDARPPGEGFDLYGIEIKNTWVDGIRIDWPDAADVKGNEVKLKVSGEVKMPNDAYNNDEFTRDPFDAYDEKIKKIKNPRRQPSVAMATMAGWAPMSFALASSTDQPPAWWEEASYLIAAQQEKQWQAAEEAKRSKPKKPKPSVSPLEAARVQRKLLY